MFWRIMDIKMKLNTRKKRLKFPGHIMRKEGWGNLILTKQIEGLRKATRDIHVGLEQMDGRTGFRKKTK